MKIKIEINNKQKKLAIKNKFVKQIVKIVLETELKKNLIYHVGIFFVTNSYIKKLNQKYFRRNRATDVIAFPLEEREFLVCGQPKINNIFLGDVFISTERAIQQAREYQHSSNEELALLIIHGILHLLGYDDLKIKDKREMQAKEQKYLRKL